jgi:proteasome accessory factor B
MTKHLDRKVYFVPWGGRRKYEERIEDVGDMATGVLHHQRLRIGYPTKDGKERTLLFDPYSLLLYQNGLYIAGFSHEHKAIIKLTLDACTSVEWCKGDAFEYPEDYHPKDLVKGAFGMIPGEELRVRIRFAKDVVRYIERAEWHPTQVTTKNPDGTLDLAMTVSGKIELVTWILSYGPNAEVLEPPELRKKIAEKLEQAAAKYRH